MSWLVWIPLLLCCSHPDDWSVIISYLLAGIALIIGKEKMDNVSFGRNILSVILRLAEGLLLGLLLLGVFSAIYASVKFLFDLSLKEECYSYPAVFIGLVVTPLLCCSLLDKGSDIIKGESLLRIIVDFILSTALVIYTVILYGYIFRILLRCELPEGGVAYMVLGFLSVGLGCYLLRLQLEKRHYEWFYKSFPAIAAAPLVLLWIGIIRRVGEYGLTDTRFYLMVLSVLVTAYCIMLVCERTRRFQLMSLIMAVAAALFTFVPGIRARDFGLRNQMSRLDKLLPEVLVDGRFPVIDDYHELVKDTVRTKYIEESYGRWSYLKAQMDSSAFNRRYGHYGEYQLEITDLQNAKNDIHQATLWSLNDISGDIDLGPYNQIVPEVYMQEDSLGLAFFNINNPVDTLIYCPVRERLERADGNTAPEEILIYENGIYKVVFWDITDDKAKFANSLGYSMYVIFKIPSPAQNDN
ncbi:MAG: DUF4153 domain-containing protein [Bacteroidales bacterium]|nr:DUF4153 domain-containing protein [Bacteroidales bacterium]